MNLPPLVRGACMATLPPGSLVPVTAVFAAVGCAIILRSAYDLANPIRVGDEREAGRHLLQWCLVPGLALLLGLSLNNLAGSRFVPPPDELGPWLLGAVAGDGALLALRSLVRMQIDMWTPAPSHSVIIPELVARISEEDEAAAAPMPMLDRREPDRGIVSRSNFPGLVFGAMLLGVAISGWNLRSLCLIRLPR
jgi:hypothetical protein